MKQSSKIEFELNKDGVCAGLAGLYVKYALENKSTQFFSILEQLSTLPKDYKFGTNQTLDSFIIQIEKVFRPGKYSNYQIGQGDLDQILTIREKPLKNEFNLGLITNEASWENILSCIGNDNRAYYIASHNHAIAASFKDGKYTIYDPNKNTTFKDLCSAHEVIQVLKTCFNHSTDVYGLDIRAFANPGDTPAVYPSHEQLLKLAFIQDTDIQRTFTEDQRIRLSSEFATIAKDHQTLTYLFQHNAIQWDKLVLEYLNPEFHKLLITQPPCPELKQALLKSIFFSIQVGNIKSVRSLLERYTHIFTTKEEQEQCEKELELAFGVLQKNKQGLLRTTGNYRDLILLCEQHKLDHNSSVQTNYIHLELLTRINEDADKQTIDQVLSTCAPEQLIKQIELAASLNQKSVLNALISRLNNTTIDPKDHPSIFTEDLLNAVDANTLKLLFKNRFVANIRNPKLLTLCTLLKDKTLFELYARSVAEQENKSRVWNLIDNNNFTSLDLETKIGSVFVLNALVLLKKNKLIKKAWRESIEVDTIKGALVNAILSANNEMSLFLHSELKKKKSTIDEDTSEFLLQKALEDQDISILSIISDLNVPVLNNLKHIKKLLILCDDYNDFSSIKKSFHSASPQVKKLILEIALNYNFKPVLELCITQEPELFRIVFGDWIHKPVSNERDKYLSKINKLVGLLPTGCLQLALDEQQRKSIISYSYHQKLFNLIPLFSANTSWSEAEFNVLINDLINSKNEEALIRLIKDHPHLGQDPKLFNTFLQAFLLKTVEHLLLENLNVDEEVYPDLLRIALYSNNKSLINLLIKQKKITPQTELSAPLPLLLEDAIEQGRSESLEPFINSELDFGLDFKQLFLWCCQYKQPKIANSLLVKNIPLNEAQIKTAMGLLFNNQPPAALFETIYQNGHGRLYNLLLKTDIQSPRAALINSIKDPGQDPLFQKTALYLEPLKRAIKEKSKTLFDKLFAETNMPSELDQDLLTFLNDPFLPSSVTQLIENKYSLAKLITYAMTQSEWAVVAHLLKNHQLNELDADLLQQVQTNNEKIILGFLKNLETCADKGDARPFLFQLLVPEPNPRALTELAIPFHETIQHVLEKIELDMIKQKKDLNNKVYRFRSSTQSFVRSLDKLNLKLNTCMALINNTPIDLNACIEHEELINQFAEIKEFIAINQIPIAYLSEQHEELLEQLTENTRFKLVCQHELRLFAFMQQFNFSEKPLNQHSKENQQDFNKALGELHKELTAQKLPDRFVLPEIQPYLQSYQAVITAKSNCISGITNYLTNRNNTLNYFSWYFDYERGANRANHYLKLIENAQTDVELSILKYAILVNVDGSQLKKNVAQALGYNDVDSAKIELKKSIKEVQKNSQLNIIDKIIASINQKTNDNNHSLTTELFSDEITSLTQLSQKPGSPLINNSIFSPVMKQVQLSWREWISSWFSSKSSNEDQLSAK